ncbi:MAG: hypothetical protein PF440_12015 [Thiomicrorhabdus sp.]|nr:hypothetical protein [Thiomicrorhabdus sp.]
MLREPIPVHFLGWESDTYTLQKHGWELAISKDEYAMQWRLLLRLPEQHLVGLSDVIQLDDVRGAVYDRFFNGGLGMDKVAFRVEIAQRIDASHHMIQENYTQAIDAEPVVSSLEFTMEDLFHGQYFRPLGGGKEIFLKKASVEEIMQIALDKQEPERVAIQTRRRAKRERETYKQNGVTRAKLIMVA